MCFNNGAADAAAAAARQQAADLQAREDKRQADIKAGKASIDDAFKGFDDSYYGKFKQTYLDNANPQIDTQYGLAKDKLIAALAGKGTLDSTIGANKFGLLQKTKSDAEGAVANAAEDAVTGMKQSIANTKGNLYNLNLSAADPQSMAAQAQASAGSIVAPNSMPNLSGIFSSVLQPFVYYNNADAKSMNPSLPWNQFNYGPVGGSGTAKWGS